MSDEQSNQNQQDSTPGNLAGLMKKLNGRADGARLKDLEKDLTVLVDQKAQAERTIRQVDAQIKERVAKYEAGF